MQVRVGRSLSQWNEQDAQQHETLQHSPRDCGARQDAMLADLDRQSTASARAASPRQHISLPGRNSSCQASLTHALAHALPYAVAATKIDTGSTQSMRGRQSRQKAAGRCSIGRRVELDFGTFTGIVAVGLATDTKSAASGFKGYGQLWLSPGQTLGSYV